MTELLTAAQMRAFEQVAIASGRVTGLALMERAGRGVVDAVFAEWPELAAGSFKAVVLCGPGNNGGDGFVVARLLKESGWEVEVSLYGDADRLPPDARVNHVRWTGMGAVTPLGHFQPRHRKTDLFVDALFGTGLTRPLSPDVKAHMNAHLDACGDCRVVAVDVPSGVCADSGRLLGDLDPLRRNADLTVAFHAAKIGHYLADGPGACGKTVIVDIGLESTKAELAVGGVGDDLLGRRKRLDAVCYLNTEYLNAGVWDPASARCSGASLAKSPHQHKFGYGHALILAGGPGKGGAARMAARGALRIGAGLVSLGVPPAALQENAARLDAVMLRSLKDAAALSAWLHKDARINALCVGPGFGTGLRHGAALEAVLDARRPTVLDADALTLLAQDKVLFDKLHARCILTPHAGEFARLFPIIAAQLAAPAATGPATSKVDATRAAAQRAGCVVLYKGADTVIADPQGRCSINSAHYDRAAPWLATAGSGDVLAGFIAGLLARGVAPMQAAETAAWLHVACARSFGPGLIAEDLPEELPKVLRAMLR